jgi:hypothetical protein
MPYITEAIVGSPPVSSSHGFTSMMIIDFVSLALAAPRALAVAMSAFFSSAAFCSSGVKSLDPHGTAELRCTLPQGYASDGVVEKVLNRAVHAYDRDSKA